MSINATDWTLFISARLTAKFTAIVVVPTPPLLPMILIIFPSLNSFSNGFFFFSPFKSFQCKFDFFIFNRFVEKLSCPNAYGASEHSRVGIV